MSQELRRQGGGNGAGVAGVSWFSTVVPLKVTYQEWEWFQWHTRYDAQAIANAIAYAEGARIPILNASFESSQEYAPIKAQIENYQGLFVCAAGNGGGDLSNTSAWPAKWHLSNMIVVGASDSNDSPAQFSNYSSSLVDVFAPGTGIVSCYPTALASGGVATLAGTSQATPFVSGTAALLASQYPSLMNVPSLRASILGNVSSVSSLSSKCATGGRLNANWAISNPYHIHVYDRGYQYSTPVKHLVLCKCGAGTLETHVWDFGNTWWSGSYEYGYCAFCHHSFPLN